MTSDRIQLICLDLGGVLIRICRHWEEACGVVGLPTPAGANDPQTLRGLSEIVIQHESGHIDEHRFDEGVAKLLGVRPADVSAVSRAWLRGPYPGAVEMIDALIGRSDVRVACLSNTNPRHFRMMSAAGPNYLGLERLHHRFLSYEIGHMKPAPEIYAHVQSVAGIASESILFFDDNADNIATARAAGWNAELIDHALDTTGQVTAHVRRYLADLDRS